MKLEKWHIIVGNLATLCAGLWFLNGQWNQAKAVEDVRMTATSNKKQILEFELQRICERYRKNWPCTTAGMNDRDRARYEQYQRWYDEERRRLDRQMGG